MKIIGFFLLVFLTSCGDTESRRKRCFTKEEAKAACITDIISRTGVTSELAEYECSPYYQYEGCYDINL